MSLTVNNLMRGKVLCDYTTKYSGTLTMYEMCDEYLVTYRAELTNVDTTLLTHTGEFSHAAHMYEVMKKQLQNVEKGIMCISQSVRTHIAKNSGGYEYRQNADTTWYFTTPHYNNIIAGMDDVVAPIIEQYLTTEEQSDVGEEQA